MEQQQPNPGENQGFSQENLNEVVNQRNEQTMQEQADLARNAQENQDKAKRVQEAQWAVERATNSNIVTEDQVPKTEEPEAKPTLPAQPPIERIPEHLKNQE